MRFAMKMLRDQDAGKGEGAVVAPAVDMSATIAKAVSDGIAQGIRALKADRVPAGDPAPLNPEPEAKREVGVPAMLKQWAKDSDRHQGKGLGAARCILSVAHAFRNPGMSTERAAKALGFVEESRALAESVASGGGTLVPVQYVSEIIGLLRAEAVFRKAGARIVPMPNGTMEMPEQTGGATASYDGENLATTPSEPTTGAKKLSAKTLTGLVPVSDQLLADAPMSAEQFVRDDLVRVMALREDLAFLRGVGSAQTPMGCFRQGTGTAMTATPDLDTVVSDLDGAEYRMDDANVQGAGGDRVWFAHPRIKKYLKGLKTATGDYRFREELEKGELNGHPIFFSTQIPRVMLSGADTGGTETEIGLVYMPDVLIGDCLSLEIEAFRGGTYESGASVYSGISRRQTIVRAVARHDILLKHAASCQVITGVTWGA